MCDQPGIDACFLPTAGISGAWVQPELTSGENTNLPFIKALCWDVAQAEAVTAKTCMVHLALESHNVPGVDMA